MSQINILTGKDKFETTLSVEDGKYYIDICRSTKKVFGGNDHK
jgi:hypothetical protein